MASKTYGTGQLTMREIVAHWRAYAKNMRLPAHGINAGVREIKADPDYWVETGWPTLLQRIDSGQVNPAPRYHTRGNPKHPKRNPDPPNLSSSIYQERVRVRGWNVPVGPLMDANVGGQLLRRRLPEYTKADHEAAARYWRELAEDYDAAWHKRILSEHRRVFGEDWRPTDYKISGIGREEYSESAKDYLREMAHSASAARAAAAAHWKAAGHRKRLEFPRTKSNPVRVTKRAKRAARSMARRYGKKRARKVAGAEIGIAKRAGHRKQKLHFERVAKALKNPLPMFPIYVKRKAAQPWHLVAVARTKDAGRSIGHLLRNAGYHVRVTDGAERPR